jgi:hypothetical protein
LADNLGSLVMDGVRVDIFIFGTFFLLYFFFCV